MALPTGTISIADVNAELGRATNANTSLNETAVRQIAATVAGPSVLSGQVSRGDLRGGVVPEIFVGGVGGSWQYNELGFNVAGYARTATTIGTRNVPAIGSWSPAPAIAFLDGLLVDRLYVDNTFGGATMYFSVNGTPSYTGNILIAPSATVNDPWPNGATYTLEHTGGNTWRLFGAGGFSFSSIRSFRIQKA
jgi:hypothetical protein